MQTHPETTSSSVDQDLVTLTSLDAGPHDRVLRAILGAIHEHESTGDPEVLVEMARGVAFTLRMQRSEAYQKMVANGPTGPSGRGRPVSEVLAEFDELRR